MPKLDGFEVLELIGGEVPVIFVTAYDEFALRAFEVHAVDYLLKPFTGERLAAALARVEERTGGEAAEPAALRKAARPSGAAARAVVIRDGAQVHVLPVEKIDYVEAQDDYVAFRTGGQTLLKEQTLGDLEGQLDGAAVRADPPVVSAEHRAARARGALCEGQPHRDPGRWHEAADQPGGVSAAAGTALNGVGLRAVLI